MGGAAVADWLVEPLQNGADPCRCTLGPRPIAYVSGFGGADYRFKSGTVYYPTDAAETGHLASIILIGGFGCGPSSLKAWAPYYASHGIVAMTIGTHHPFRDMPWDRSESLLDAVRVLKAEHARVGSALYGRLDTSRVAVQGWSMGGGGALLAALADPTLKCAIAVAPWNRQCTDLTATVPTLFLVGSSDRQAPAHLHAWPQYRATTAPKLILEVSGGDHAIANGPAGGNLLAAIGPMCCGLPDPMCGKGKTIFGVVTGTALPCCLIDGPTGHASDREAMHGDIGSLALAWLRVFLEGDERFRAQLQARPPIASAFESELSPLLRHATVPPLAAMVAAFERELGVSGGTVAQKVRAACETLGVPHDVGTIMEQAEQCWMALGPSSAVMARDSAKCGDRSGITPT